MCNKGLGKTRNEQYDNVYLRLIINKQENIEVLVFTWMAMVFLEQLEVMG